MESAPHTEPPANEFYVLKSGQITGPFTEAAIHARIERGEISSDSFVQQGGLPIWQPLARWLERERAPLDPAITPDWRSIVTWAAVRLRSDMLQGSVIVGGACAAIGTLVAIFAQWPALLWLPWFVLAVLAGVLAMRNGRAVPGLLLLLAVAAVPVLFSLATREKVMADRADTMATSEGAAGKTDAHSAIAPPEPVAAPPDGEAPGAKTKALPKFAEGEE